MILTQENYYSKEANQENISVSRSIRISAEQSDVFGVRNRHFKAEWLLGDGENNSIFGWLLCGFAFRRNA